MVQSMDYVCTFTTECPCTSANGMACSFFEFGMSANVTKVFGTA